MSDYLSERAIQTIAQWPNSVGAVRVHDCLKQVLSQRDALQKRCDELTTELQKVVDWHNSIHAHQEPLLRQGLEEACKNWDVATNVQVLDLSNAITILADQKGE